jgi:hypothetical protein
MLLADHDSTRPSAFLLVTLLVTLLAVGHQAALLTVYTQGHPLLLAVRDLESPMQWVILCSLDPRCKGAFCCTTLALGWYRNRCLCDQPPVQTVPRRRVLRDSNTRRQGMLSSGLFAAWNGS